MREERLAAASQGRRRPAWRDRRASVRGAGRRRIRRNPRVPGSGRKADRRQRPVDRRPCLYNRRHDRDGQCPRVQTHPRPERGKLARLRRQRSAHNTDPQDQRMTVPFKTIRARAEKRKGGPKALSKLLPPKPDPKVLAKLGDDRALAEMTRRVFCAGFAWSVIETKWDGFEQAFEKFEPGRLTLKPDEFWDALMKDTRIVRNGAKIMSVRANASFVREIAKEHGSFGKMLAKWPASNETGLLELLAKRGSRLGGNTGQMLLRFLGWAGFVPSKG